MPQHGCLYQFPKPEHINQYAQARMPLPVSQARMPQPGCLSPDASTSMPKPVNCILRSPRMKFKTQVTDIRSTFKLWRPCKWPLKGASNLLTYTSFIASCWPLNGLSKLFLCYFFRLFVHTLLFMVFYQLHLRSLFKGVLHKIKVPLTRASCLCFGSGKFQSSFSHFEHFLFTNMINDLLQLINKQLC